MTDGHGASAPDGEWLYAEHHIAFLEEMWGEGYLSPGGSDEVARVLDGIDIAGRRVLDIGCGTGGATLDLVRRHGAGEVVGIDVEVPVCSYARERARLAGLDERVEIRLVEPGPLPFEDGSFDAVFSKDSIVHIADKEALSRDVFRVLRPGGWFVASDWLIAHDDAPSPAMAAYIAAEALDFGMASPTRYEQALRGAGFVDIALRSRNSWYRDIARQELERLTGSDRERWIAMLGADEVAVQTRTWRSMVPVLESGEHCPHHFRARRPASAAA